MKKTKTSAKKSAGKKPTKAKKAAHTKPAAKKPAAVKAAKATKAKKTPEKKSGGAKPKSGKAATPKKRAVKTSVKKSAPVKPATKTPTQKKNPKPAAKAVETTKAAKAAPAPKSAKAKPEKPGKATAKAARIDPKATASPAEAFPALEESFKRPAKPFFTEVKPGMERVIKRGDKTAASPVIDLQARRKGPATEETPEELAERIERELQSQSFLKRNRMRPQLCTKCGINAVSPRFTIDRELAYCDICAEILHLGETKEARRMEFNLSVKKEEDDTGSGDEEPVPEEVD